MLLLKMLSTCSVKVLKIYIWLYKKLMFSYFIRFYLEIYLELSLCCIINLNYLVFYNAASICGSLVSLIAIVLVTIGPIWILIFLERNKNKLIKVDKIQLFGSLFEDVKTKSFLSRHERTIFLIRRLIFVLVMTFINHYYIFQIIILMVI